MRLVVRSLADTLPPSRLGGGREVFYHFNLILPPNHDSPQSLEDGEDRENSFFRDTERFSKIYSAPPSTNTPQELGEREEKKSEISEEDIVLFSLPSSSTPYPYLFDYLFVGGITSSDIKRLYRGVRE